MARDVCGGGDVQDGVGGRVVGPVASVYWGMPGRNQGSVLEPAEGEVNNGRVVTVSREVGEDPRGIF